MAGWQLIQHTLAEFVILTTKFLLSWSQSDLSCSSVSDECVAVCMNTKYWTHTYFLALSHQYTNDKRVRLFWGYIWKKISTFTDAKQTYAQMYSAHFYQYSVNLCMYIFSACRTAVISCFCVVIYFIFIYLRI